MTAVMDTATLSPEAYLAWEANQETKNEYWAGEVVPTVGARLVHNRVAGNLFFALSAALKGTACEAFMADVRLAIPEVPAYFYPDVIVTCDPADRAADLMVQAPTLIIEVLSPSTASHDRGRKFSAYRRIASLREYLLIDVDERRIDGFRRNDEGAWVVGEFAPGEPVAVASLEVTIPWADVFHRVD